MDVKKTVGFGVTAYSDWPVGVSDYLPSAFIE